jgi:para-nitrobenzyl esterase
VAVGQGAAAGLDLLIGTNRDELALFGLGRPEWTGLDEAGVVRWVENVAPDVPSGDLMEEYRTIRQARGESVDSRALMIAMGSDGIFRWPSLQLAAAQAAQGGDTYVYLFEWESPAFGGVLGACHALELPFVFGVVHVPVVQMFTGDGPESEALSAQMQRAWLAFAHTGNPTHAELEWPTWDPGRRSTMVFGRLSGAADAPRHQELSVWERHRPLGATLPP